MYMYIYVYSVPRFTLAKARSACARANACAVCIWVQGTCILYIHIHIRVCIHVCAAACVAHDTRNGWSSTTDARATHGVGLGAREWLWRAEGWLMHATTIAPQHAVALCTLAPPPPPPWHRSGERHRCFARTGAETFSGSGARLIVRCELQGPLSLFLCLSHTDIYIALSHIYMLCFFILFYFYFIFNFF